MATPSAPLPPSPLLQNLLLFGRLLRALGLRVTTGQIGELAGSLAWIDVRNRDDFHSAARALLVTRRDDLSLFDRAFDAFWSVWSDPALTDAPPNLDDFLPAPPAAAQERPDGAGQAGDAEVERRLLGPLRRNVTDEAGDEESDSLLVTIYSAQEALRSKDFSLFDEDEIADARRFLSALRWTITRRRSRRLRPSPRGTRLDVRRSLRRSLRHGGEMLDIARRGPKLKRRQLVLLCDISGSMERYTRMLLHFLYSVESSVQQAEVFVFGTRLTRVTRQMRGRDPDGALRAVAGEVQDWSGGTRIGDSLRTFNRRWARRVLGQGAIVLVISDGWDRGDPGVLAAEMERLQRTSYRLLWLNPLLGSAQYQPLTQGIQAALPYVDNFLPVHNLQSLEVLAGLLNQIQDGRPDRRRRSSRPPSSIRGIT